MKFAPLAISFSAATMVVAPALAQQSVEQFYRNKTITLTVPTSPGGISL